MKSSTKKIIFLSAAALAGMYAYNKFVEENAASKNLLSADEGSFFDWKEGSIYYTKKGTGSPILLVHDTDSAASSAEWSKISHKLSKDHTVYSIDLLGCGRSDKPEIQYTNYLYVQLIQAFIDEVVKEEVTVISSNMSCSFIIMANHLNDKLFQKMIFINPTSLTDLCECPETIDKAKQCLFNLPLVGTFLYNLRMNPARIDLRFRYKYFFNPSMISSRMKETYYESAHLGNSKGKFLYSSLHSKYMNLNIAHAVKKISKPTYIIGSKNMIGNLQVLDDYHKTNTKLEITYISNCNQYPHMELPDKTFNIIKNII